MIKSQLLLKMLKLARLDKRLSQKDLAKKLGIPQSHISKIESGKINPTIAILIEIARTLDLELMAIPKKHMILVEGIIRGSVNGSLQEPMYQLDDNEDENDI